MKAKRRSFAKKLHKLIKEGANIIYADESTVNNHIRTAKCWQYCDKPVKQLIDKKRIGGVTIYGAIGNCLRQPTFVLGASTNKVEFKAFLEQVLRNLKEGVVKPNLILDNHSAHISMDLREWIN